MSASNYLAVREDWLSLSQEEVLEPELKIVDAHHHFYDRPGWHYLQEQYIADARSGHDVRASVYMQAMTRYRLDGPDVLKPVGETAFVVESTRAMARDVPQVALGIVGHADLRVGAGVREVLDAHIDAGEGRFRGIRHLATWDADSTLVNPLSAAPRGLLLDRNYREGFAQLAPLGLSYDAWVFFPQLLELFDLAKAFPDTTIVINHCGGIVRIGSYQERGPEVFRLWAQSMRQLAQLPNVFVKLGGLGMRINGFDFEKGDVPPGSEMLAQAWRPWIELCIEAFGAHRCMFESNFPVDKGSYSYRTLWNAFKRLTKRASNQERQDLFEGTASQVYRLH
ncbi:MULTISPECIES: amidohydrolase [unclassified Variovorax]|uniref:amidohydrolase family protein n=1 Tax=unclassified Variovorax TaxID=663243 RepID=UPI001118D055|nr:amidohydrolase family protein [Variovorax sp. KBS0712]TSD57019.1 amidohydrolase family protein [Variovorax sp. KBS0712]